MSASTNWCDIYNYQDANDAYNVFSTRICNLFENSFRLTKLSRAKLKNKKWITLGLRNSNRHKNKLYNKCIQTKSKEDEIKYKKIIEESTPLLPNKQRLTITMSCLIVKLILLGNFGII